MNIENIKQLLEKYFEGQTSASEEKVLRKYFSEENTASELDCYKPLFQYFTEERNCNKEAVNRIQTVETQTISFSSRKKILIWFSSGVAACLILFLGLKNRPFFNDSQTGVSVAYIDGKKHTDISSIRTELFHILSDLEEENELIFSSQIEILDDLIKAK